MPDRTLQRLFSCYEKALRTQRQPLKNLKAIDSIIQCRTPAMGTSTFQCGDDHRTVDVHHSCRHRSCPLCGDKSRLDWVEKQKTRLFNTAHFHVVFTLPHEYLDLWRYNERLFSDLLFRASERTLLTLMKDPKRHGVTPGILIALHTWGRQLNLHPHTHCLVTAGGLNKNKEWQACGDYLLPIRVVKQFYRGTFQALIDTAFDAGQVVLPPDMTPEGYRRIHRAVHQKEWSVRIEERYETGKGVMLYLSRYLRGGPIKGAQLTDVKADAITFRYLDHRDKRTKTLKVTPAEFLRRVLSHVPPSGSHTVRHYGLYAGCARTQRQVCQALLGTLVGHKVPVSEQLKNMLLSCPHCGGAMQLIYQRWRDPLKAFSIIKAATALEDNVQQDDEADVATIGLLNSS